MTLFINDIIYLMTLLFFGMTLMTFINDIIY
jgi:hypothetical protein